jgi:HK97 family phage major capsid protein
MSILDITRQRLGAVEAARSAKFDDLELIPAAAVTESRSLTDDESTQSESLIAAIKADDVEIDALRSRVAELEQITARAASAKSVPTFIRQPEAAGVADVRSLSRSEARDAAMRVVDATPDYVVSAERKATVEQLIATRSQRTDGDSVARRLLVTESDAYRGAFLKALHNPSSPAWTNEESSAIAEYRAMSIGVDTAGGFGIPVLIDPTILITTGTLASPLLNVARIETITTDTWRGVSAAATAWSFDAEAATVSDDASTLAQPSVVAHKAQAFIPYSIEVGMDYPSFAAEMGRLLDAGYQDLLADKMNTGTGSDQPFGIFVALDANTNAEVVVTTNNQFGDVDIDKVWAALPERWRASATWLMSVGYENKVRAFGSGTATSRFTVDQTRAGISLLNGRPVITSDYAPAVATTTTARNILVVGDFSNYVIAQRAGMSVELVPHIFDVTNNRPTGQRGLYAFSRVGADSVLDTAFRMLTNT